MIASTGSTDPSVNRTRSPCNSATSGLATASPEPSRSSSSLETVGCASRNRWLGWAGRSPPSGRRPDEAAAGRHGAAATSAARGSCARPGPAGARTRTWASPMRRSGSRSGPARPHPCARARRRCRPRCCQSPPPAPAGRAGRAARSDRCSDGSGSCRRRTVRETPETTGPNGGRCRPAGRRSAPRRRPW